MARKESVQLELVTPGGEPEPAAGAASPRRPRARPEKRRGWRERLRLWALWTGSVAALIAVIVLLYRLDQFLASDPRFVLPPLASGGSGVHIEGAVYASRERLLDVFAGDLGRSIYLIPLERRRRALLAIDWVRRAAVLREWPNRVVIRIVERTPVAFVMLPAGGQAFRTALIDADGVLLDMPSRARFNLPALFGIRTQQPQAARRERVRLVLRCLEEARSYSGQISEIDVSDPENVKVTQSVEGRALRLWLGKERFLSRLSNFLTHYGEIQRRLPQAETFDLRLDDRITALDAALPMPKRGGAHVR